MGSDILSYVLIILCGAQAYTWYRFTKFEAIASINIIGMTHTYTTKLLELTEEVSKLKEQLKQYEEKSKAVSS